MKLYELENIKQILRHHNLWAKKGFGQNFLINKDILDSILNAQEITKEDTIVEIGPGIGVLTKELAQKAKNVISVELDSDLLPVLAETLADFNNIEIKNENALDFIPPKTPYKVIANIPYNITSPLISHFLQNTHKPTEMTILIQKEVAEKIISKQGKHTVLSIQNGLFGEATIVKIVPNNSFYPEPKVTSAVINIKTFDKFHPNFTTPEDAKGIIRLARISFSNRRKKIVNGLRTLIPQAKLEVILDKLGIDKEIRPQALSIPEWKMLNAKTSHFFSKQK